MRARLIASVVFLLPGCASLASRVAEEAAPSAIESGLETISSEPNKSKMQKLLEDTPVKTTVVSVDEAVVDIILARLAHPKNEPHLRRIAKSIVTTIAQQVAHPMPPQVTKAKEEFVTRTTRQAVGAAVDELRRMLPELLADPDVRQALTPFSRSAGAGAVKGVTDTLTGDTTP